MFYTWDSWLSHAVMLLGPSMLALSVWNSARITARRRRLVDGIAARFEAIYPSPDKPLGVQRTDGSGELNLEDELRIIHETMIDLKVAPDDEPFDRDLLIFIRRMMVREYLEVEGKRGRLRKFITRTFTRRPPPFRKSRKDDP